MNPFTPLVSRIRYKYALGFESDYRKAAVRSWEISPPQKRRSLQAIYERADLDKITEIAPDGVSLEFQVAKLSPSEFEHGPTVAHEFRDAMLIGSHVLLQKSIRYVGQDKLPLVCPRHMPRLPDGVLANTGYGLRYFGHWMGDDLPLLMAATDLGQAVSILTDPTQGQREYLEWLGSSAVTLTSGRFERFVCIDDAGQNAYKRARYDKLKAMARAHRSEEGAEGVMLVRGRTGVRRVLLNEDEVADVARSRGFDIVDASTTSAFDLLRICAGAKTVMGVEGSQLTNGLMWMDTAGTLLTLQPPQRFSTILKDFCDCMGVRYAMIVGELRGPSDFHIDISALERLLDRIATSSIA